MDTNRQKRILIIEDDTRISKALAIRLGSRGYCVLQAYDGVQGVSSAVMDRPDLVLLDISMPGGSGLTVAERLQGFPQTSGVPLIFMTASRKPGLRQRAEELGAKGYFEKPFDTEEVIDTIQKALSAHAPPADRG